MQRDTKPRPKTIRSSVDGGADVTVLVYQCQLKLEDLRDTSHPEIKFCDHCARSVFRARDAEGVLRLVAADACAWIDDGGMEVIRGMIVSAD